jgi:hypothetical protein
MGAEGTTVCPLEAKKSRYFWRISFDVIIFLVLSLINIERKNTDFFAKKD